MIRIRQDKTGKHRIVNVAFEAEQVVLGCDSRLYLAVPIRRERVHAGEIRASF